jgi:hypothetical protein
MMGTLILGLSVARTTFCACAAVLNVHRLHRTRAVPRATITILMPWPPCRTQLGLTRHSATFDFAPLLRVYRTSKTPGPQLLIYDEFIGLVGGASASIWPAAALAQTYPSRPITMVAQAALSMWSAASLRPEWPSFSASLLLSRTSRAAAALLASPA